MAGTDVVFGLVDVPLGKLRLIVVSCLGEDARKSGMVRSQRFR